MGWKLPLSRLSFRWQITLLGAVVVVLFLAVLVAGYSALHYTTSAVLNDEKKSLATTTRELVREYEERGNSGQEGGAGSPLQNPSEGSSQELLTLLARIVLQRTDANVAGFYSSATDDLTGYTFSGRKGDDSASDLSSAENSDIRPAVVQAARTAFLTGRPSEQVLAGVHDFTLIEAVPIRGAGQNYIGSAWT